VTGAGRPSGQQVGHALARQSADGLPRRQRGTPDVREKGDVAGGEQARIDGRLVLVDIEAGAEDAAGFERVSQGRLVHDRPAGGVD
jgi:hypothetical protein